MQRLLSILGVLVYLNSFSQGNLNWPESINLGYFDNSELVTQANASIAIQESNFSNFSVNFPGETNPQSIPSGSIIGVFYDINNSEAIEEWVCGGFNFWPENNESFTIAAFEDEFGGEVNGFQSGDEYVWFLRINNSEDPLDGWTDYIASSAILQSDDYFSTTFGPNLFHNLLSANFVLYSEWSNCMDISACNYNQAATISDLDSCFYPENDEVDCNNDCFDDDGDGICNYQEIDGCTDNTPCGDIDINCNGSFYANNYNPLATDSTECVYKGCTDDTPGDNPDIYGNGSYRVLNYDPSGTFSGRCLFPSYEFDWNPSYWNPGTASFAIDSIIADGIIGFPENYSCIDINIGAFYGNNDYLTNAPLLLIMLYIQLHLIIRYQTQ